MSGMLSCPDRQHSLQNYGKPTFIQPTAQEQLSGSMNKGRHGGKTVESGRNSHPFSRQAEPLRSSCPSPEEVVVLGLLLADLPTLCS